MSSYFTPGKPDAPGENHLLPKPGKKSTALIVAGGGMKGSFAGGVLAALHQYIPSTHFDLIVGVSSGSCSAAYYATGYEQSYEESIRILDIWKKELIGNKFISFFHPFKGKTVLDQEYLIDFLFGEKYRLPSENFDKKESPPLYVAVTNLAKLQAEYIKASASNALHLLKAATSLPIATRGKWKLNDQFYGDGGIADPIPVEKVIEAGYKDITVVLNTNHNEFSDPVSKFSGWLAYPTDKKLGHMITKVHHTMYNRAVQILKHPPKDVRIKVISPSHQELSMVTTSAEKLTRSINRGIEAGFKAVASIKDEFSHFKSKLKDKGWKIL
ncbi:patatin-like phospholipase family protein [Leptospira ellisii]|uniref:Hydrolase n=1 Tax=Leptospira ellisii TaxID=2023197 RepID=A0A2N0BNX1_9LEPT|nr:patatin-like phospholipase family protein [Leptospira ellisii]MDV6237495.1 patatin-like phospholipase family protein [Leptospira ellisii]PJZ92344.1 hydrolase [Leptospira ellisii]PKA05665.1 hydrolase [Leptospira ellisii]